MKGSIPSRDEVLSWYRTLNNWGRWGPNDERGTLNLITPEKRVQAASLVHEGLVVSCARTIGYDATPERPHAYASLHAQEWRGQHG